MNWADGRFYDRPWHGHRLGEGNIPVGVDLYAILGVGKDASAEEIRSRYRKLAARYHPDRNPGDKEAYDKFVRISMAYDILSDPSKRAAYDAAVEARSGGQRETGDGPTFKKKKTAGSQGTLSTYVTDPEAGREAGVEKIKRVEWGRYFSAQDERERPLSDFIPGAGGEDEDDVPPLDWGAFFGRRPKVDPMTREGLLAGVSKLPLEEIWKYIRLYRDTPGFKKAGLLVVGPLAGKKASIAEDLASLAGVPRTQVLEFVQTAGDEAAWTRLLRPMAGQIALAVESMKPDDLPGYFFVNWDPSGQVLELLYGERLSG